MKNFFLTQDRTFQRKLTEVCIALIIEAHYSKLQILEYYLNEIYLGQRGSKSIFGVWEAARFYFGKAPRDLSAGEAAALAGRDVAGARERLAGLRDRLEGRRPDFDRFMQKWGPLFGDNPPQSLDELMEHIQQQLSQVQSLMDSLSPGARRELEEALQSALDPRLADEMAEFASLMQSLLPPDELARQYPFLGDESMTLE